MKNQNINKSILAMFLATSANVSAALQTPVLGMIQPKLNDLKDRSIIYNLDLPARFKDSKEGLLEGSVFLRLYKSNLRPTYLNQLVAEYEGNFYFESKGKVNDKYPYHTSLGGEDDQVILDLVNRPSADENFQPKVYNMHSCNSTNTNCEPMTMQFRVFKDGNIELKGRFVDGLEVFTDNQWVTEIFEGKLKKVEEKK